MVGQLGTATGAFPLPRHRRAYAYLSEATGTPVDADQLGIVERDYTDKRKAKDAADIKQAAEFAFAKRKQAIGY